MRLSRPPFKSDVSSNLEGLNVHYENLLWFKFFVITIMKATMMPAEKLRGEDELASDRNDMKFFLLSVVAFNLHALAVIPATIFCQRNSL